MRTPERRLARRSGRQARMQARHHARIAAAAGGPAHHPRPQPARRASATEGASHRTGGSIPAARSESSRGGARLRGCGGQGRTTRAGSARERRSRPAGRAPRRARVIEPAVRSSSKIRIEPRRRSTKRLWRPGSESNRRTRICSPLHNHSATWPVTCCAAAAIPPWSRFPVGFLPPRQPRDLPPARCAAAIFAGRFARP